MAESGGEFSSIGTSTVENFVVTGLTAGVTYEFKVESRN
jgi:hypothetical protein